MKQSMASKRWYDPAALVLAALALCACAGPRPGLVQEAALQPGRYVQQVYRSPELQPAAVAYTIEPQPVALAQGISVQEAARVFQEELVQALQANGLRVNGGSQGAVWTGNVERFAVAAPFWRFLSGRGQAQVAARGEIRRGPELLFAFYDAVTVNPAVNPRHRPPLETDLLARQAARRLAANVLNELLLPPRPEAGGAAPTALDRPSRQSTE